MLPIKFEILLLNQISQFGLKRFAAKRYLKTSQLTKEPLGRADSKATLAAQGLEVALCSPEQFAAHIKSEIARFTRSPKLPGSRPSNHLGQTPTGRSPFGTR